MGGGIDLITVSAGALILAGIAGLFWIAGSRQIDELFDEAWGDVPNVADLTPPGENRRGGQGDRPGSVKARKQQRRSSHNRSGGL